MGRFLLSIGILAILVELAISTWIAARRASRDEVELARLAQRRQELARELDR